VTLRTFDGASIPVAGTPDERLLSLGPAGEVVAVATRDAFAIRRVSDGAPLFESRDASWRAISPDRRFFAAQLRAAPYTTTVREVETGRLVATLDVPADGHRFSQDGEELVTSSNGAFDVFVVRTGKRRCSIPMVRESSDGRGQAVRAEHVGPLAASSGVLVATHTPNELMTIATNACARKTLFPAPTLIFDPGTRIAVTPDASIATVVTSEKLYRFELGESNLRNPHDVTPPVPLSRRQAFGEAKSLTLGPTALATTAEGRWVAFAGHFGLFALDATTLRNEAVHLDRGIVAG
jgi:hypothetical protein